MPTAMISPPSRGGIGHNEAQYSAPEHLAACCDVLLNSMLAHAGVV